MIEKTEFSVPLDTVKLAKNSLPQIDFKLSLNKPLGRFFYDRWEIKEELQNTVWETLLNTLPKNIGEARIIELKNGTCYSSHSDIDDRYHLNIDGQYSFLINLDSEEMFKTVKDGNWYKMDASHRHTAANFGSISRYQLVVRILLNDCKLIDPVDIKIKPICDNPRFEFDDIVSPWLNNMNKKFLLNEFKILDDGVSFNIDRSQLTDLELFSKEKFKVEIK